MQLLRHCTKNEYIKVGQVVIAITSTHPT